MPKPTNYEVFVKKIREVELLRNSFKNIEKLSLKRLEKEKETLATCDAGLRQELEGISVSQFSTYYPDARTGGLTSLGWTEIPFSEKESIVMSALNRQRQMVMVQAYEAYEEYIKTIRKEDGRYSLADSLKKFGERFYIDWRFHVKDGTDESLSLWVVMAEKVRHFVVHNSGALSRQKFNEVVNKISSESGVDSDVAKRCFQSLIRRVDQGFEIYLHDQITWGHRAYTHGKVDILGDLIGTLISSATFLHECVQAESAA
ncbi:hypothetical protein ACYCFK_17785 [Stutzerimonas stutzeri]